MPLRVRERIRLPRTGCFRRQHAFLEETRRATTHLRMIWRWHRIPGRIIDLQKEFLVMAKNAAQWETPPAFRSEERRVGKECRARRGDDGATKKTESRL